MPQRRLFDAGQGFDARQNQSAAGRRVGWTGVLWHEHGWRWKS